ncbi:MAG: hypothetical protein QM598_12505 [Protaetiibacter sp.]
MSAARLPATSRAIARSGVSGVVVAALAWVVLTGSGVAVPAEPAAAASNSAVTITAEDQDADYEEAPFPELSVTVSQTKDLVSQGVTVSWTGGRQSVAPGQTGGEDFLQIFQCWGDDPSDASRPDRTTCQYGGTLGPGSTRDSYRDADRDVDAAHDLQYTIPGRGVVLPAYTSIPFRAPDGTSVSNIVTDASTGAKTVDTAIDVNTNQYFTSYTTNEIPWAPSGADGRGSVAFEVQTAMQSSGLSCGTPTPENLDVGASCWLVVLPRGASDNGSRYITQSGLFWDTWKHALAFRLDFRPLGARCKEGTAERQVFGSELITLAMGSWQPAVCNTAGGAVLALVTGSESDALRAAATTPDSGLVVTSRALQDVETDPLVYAPLAISGLTIGFNIDRFVNPNLTVPAEIADRDRLAITSLRLTPRLLAKLLTNSYRASLPLGTDAGVVEKNPWNVVQDPDFLAINDPEWTYLVMQGYALSDVLVPQGRSDAAWIIWQYITADPEAAAFLAGTPDPWGMVVNPWSTTTAAANPSGVAFSLPREDFPKADPIERPADGSGGAINLITWRPYTADLDTSGYLTLRGDGQLLGGWDIFAVPPKYAKAARALPGRRQVLGLTSTSAAERYQVVTAELKNAAGAFVAPSTESMLAAAAAMGTSAESTQVLRYDSTSAAAKGATTAYPLTVPIYAAANPKYVSADARGAYAAFIRYATTSGQNPGDALGQLPRGYAPLPASWRASAESAAAAILSGSTQPAPTGNNSAGAGGPNGYSPASDTSGEPAQPDASGSPAAALSSSVTPADPSPPVDGPVLPLSLALGLAAALASSVAGRRKAIRSWIRR